MLNQMVEFVIHFTIVSFCHWLRLQLRYFCLFSEN